MFGDEIAVQEGYQPVGLPFCAGYAVGYRAVQSYMKKNDKTIYEQHWHPQMTSLMDAICLLNKPCSV